ncbi:YceI family protein [Flavicella sediminum]|uniref:YceI family protein n=1 Tax=Flavicella sediminum TaxID=2585141 RepID=UPI001123FB11|nr:YceI family protein [Flavicella sediminum]
MKNILKISLALFLVFNLQSCKNKPAKKEVKEKTYAIDANKTDINWTAYKTTDKVPVKGKFTLLNITKASPATTLTETLNNTEFSIPVSSIFSNNPDRDNKLKTLFFGVMKNTELLAGTLHITNETSGYVDFKMNAVVEKLPFTYIVEGNKIQLEAIMNTDSWQAQSAIESINKSCFDLHKGADGISKTWSDVAISISIYLK